MEFLNFVEANPVVFYVLVGWLSLCVGSFLNVVIHRLPTMLNNYWRKECLQFLHPEDPLPDTPKYTLSQPASHCPKCEFKIRWYHNIPVFSWLALKGKCSGCKSRISARYPFVEALTMVLSLAVAFKFGFTLTTLFAIIFTHVTIAIFFIDFDHMIIPDRLVFPLIGLGLLINSQSLFVSPQMAIYGAVIGFLSLWIIYIIMKLLTGKEGMGYGDFKYLCAIGAWFGPLILHHIFIISALSALAFVVVACTIIHKMKGDTSQPMRVIAFGPHLAIAAWIVLITL